MLLTLHIPTALLTLTTTPLPLNLHFLTADT